jgi:hypothetical protein
LYNSKFIQAIIFLLIGFVVIILGLFIAFYTKDTWNVIKAFMETITSGVNMTIAFFISMAIIVIFLELFNAIQCGFLGIILGHKRNNNKVANSVVFGFIVYLVSQTIILGLVFVYGLFDPTVMELFKTGTINVDVNAFKVLAVVSSLLYLFIIIIMNVICKIALNKGVNVE